MHGAHASVGRSSSIDLQSGRARQRQGGMRAMLCMLAVFAILVPASKVAAQTYVSFFYTPGDVIVFMPEAGTAASLRNFSGTVVWSRSATLTTGQVDDVTGLGPGFYRVTSNKKIVVMAGDMVTGSGNDTRSYYARDVDGKASGTELYTYLRNTSENNTPKLFVFSNNDSNTVTVRYRGEFGWQDLWTGILAAGSRQDIAINSIDHIQITSDSPVSALVAGSDHYDDPGAHCVPAKSSGTFYGDLFSTWIPGGEAYVYSYSDNTSVELLDTFTISPLPRASWNLNEGEVGSYAIPFDEPFAITVTATNPISLCRMYQNVGTTYGMHYMPAKSGTMIGTDFVIDVNDPFEVIAYEDGTAVEYTQRNGTVHSYTLSAFSHQLLPSATAGRLTATKAVSVVATSTVGATYVPIPVTALDTAPGPPAVFAVRHNPPDPTINDSTVTVTWATDEPATTCMSHRRNGGAWIISLCSQTYQNQHSVQIDISTYAADDLVEYYVWAVDKDNNTVLNDNNGQNYSFTITDDIPQLSVSRLSSLPPSTNDDPYTITLMVENNGISEARNVQIRERVIGMISPTAATSLLPVTTREFDLTLPVPNIAAGGFTVVSYDLIPLLYATYSTFGVNMSTPSNITYRSPSGQTFSGDFSIPVNFSSSTALGWIRGKDYAIATNISRLRSLNTAAHVGEVIEEAARLALARDGVVAELETTDRYAIEKLVNSSWNGRLGYIGFGGWRFLLFVGCQGVVPSFHMVHKCEALEDRHATTADNIYADVNTGDYFKPEVIVGRLPGEDAVRLVHQIRNSLTTVSTDRAVLMSGTGDGEDMFVEAIDSANTMLSWYTDNVKRHWKDEPIKANRTSTFQADMPNSDLVIYRDHGGVASWDNSTVDNGQAKIADFGTKNPMVWSIACNTGRVTENSLAEAFLEGGASLFIGSSQVSARSQNNDFLGYLSKYHTMSDFYPTIGEAFKWAKRRVIEDNISWASTCYADYRTKQLINEYNLFGDPKRGEASAAKSSTNHSTPSETETGAPPDHIELVIPDYVVNTTDAGIDYVTIPGDEGGTFEEEGQPIVPVYIHRVAFGPGYKVTDVVLGERGGLESATGLTLPVASFADDDGSLRPRRPSTKSAATFPAPEVQYAWRVEEQLDGTHELLLTVYPFYYDAATSAVDFYRNHAFTVDWNSTATTITDIEPFEEIFPLGEPIEGLVDVHQGSGSVMATFEVDLLDESTGEVVASMDPYAVGLDEGTTALDFGIALAATEPSTYLLRVRLTTGDELLDEDTKRIRVGVLSAIGEAFAVVPDPADGFEIGELITADAWFQNNGPNPITGRARLQVVDTATAQIVAEHFEEAVVTPAAAHHAQMIWDSTPATEGTYRISAVFGYDGLSTDPMTADVFTLRNMEVALATDREVYEVGEKVVVWATCTEADGEPLQVTPSLWLALPDASAVPIQLTYLSSLGIYSGWHYLAADSPNGPYGLALTAEATGYHSGSAQHFFSVGGAPPTPDFNWSPLVPTVGEQLQFTDTTVGSPVSWVWSFGDGATSTSQNPTHTYAAPGDKDVTLEVTNFYGTTWTMQTVAVVSAEGQIFADGFETGDCDGWSLEVP